MKAKFRLGTVVRTEGVSDIEFSILRIFLARHHAGDWGDLCEEDKEVNEEALKEGQEGRLMSVYKHGGTTIWIITEWDRSVTTILLPSEY